MIFRLDTRKIFVRVLSVLTTQGYFRYSAVLRCVPKEHARTPTVSYRSSLRSSLVPHMPSELEYYSQCV